MQLNYPRAQSKVTIRAMATVVGEMSQVFLFIYIFRLGKFQGFYFKIMRSAMLLAGACRGCLPAFTHC